MKQELDSIAIGNAIPNIKTETKTKKKQKKRKEKKKKIIIGKVNETRNRLWGSSKYSRMSRVWMEGDVES